MRTSILFFFTVLLFSNCRKNKLISFTNPEIDYSVFYDLRSIPYDTIYNGGISSGSTIFPSPQYCEKYLYKAVSINPCNRFEFCYTREVADSFFQPTTYHLYKYNFITGKSTFITSKVLGGISWGSNDWILFKGLNNSIEKIKSNGDSLTSLVVGSGAKWSPSSKYFLDQELLKIYDANGKMVKYFNNYKYTSCAWINDSLIICTITKSQNNNALIRLNINTGDEEVLIQDTSTFGFHICDYDPRSTIVIYSADGDYRENLLYTYRFSTKENQLIMKTSESWGMSVLFINSNKLLCRLSLRDYFGIQRPSYLYNLRYHIGVVDLNNIYKPRKIILD